jgi:DNA-binding response OmpR family regulator
MSGHRPILVVTPEPGIQAVIRYLFESQGETVVVAGDAVSARRRIAETLPRAILLELVLPDEDGFAFLAHLQEMPRTAALPIFLTTGRVRRGDRARALKAGAADLLTRPFDERALLDRLAEHPDRASTAPAAKAA